MSYLKVTGTQIVDEQGKDVVLRGAGLGGWMNMENFITGYPGCEFQIRAGLSDVLGPEKANFFFNRFLEYFFQDEDAQFFKSLGLNCIRIPFNYRHFEDDDNPRVLKAEGFKHLDRVIEICSRHGIYTILDLHTAPGGQNGGWHCDAGMHIATFWLHKDFQDRVTWLWTELAKHYVGNAWIAGYNPLNEPSDASHSTLLVFYDRVYTAIRSVDPFHIVFWDGNTYATDFTHFGDAHKRWHNCAYSIHDYSGYGFPSSPEPYRGSDAQRERMSRSYQRKRQWMDQQGLCVWNGEFGPVYARQEYDGDGFEETNQRRIQVLEDQLDLYNKDHLSWSIWLYKDIGFQGMVYISRTTPYIRLLQDFLLKKHHLAVDTWGADDQHVRHVYQPIVDLIASEVVPHEDDQKLYPWPVWSLGTRVTRLARNMLLAEFLIKEWAEHFHGKTFDELDLLACSFKFENCLHRDRLNYVLAKNNSLDK